MRVLEEITTFEIKGKKTSETCLNHTKRDASSTLQTYLHPLCSRGCSSVQRLKIKHTAVHCLSVYSEEALNHLFPSCKVLLLFIPVTVCPPHASRSSSSSSSSSSFSGSWIKTILLLFILVIFPHEDVNNVCNCSNRFISAQACQFVCKI